MRAARIICALHRHVRPVSVLCCAAGLHAACARRWLRVGTAVGVLGALHQYDTHYCYARFNRNLRTFVAMAETIVDYKLMSV